ncbi:alpha/beta hydrolase [Granulicella sp. dw_53]|uniref:alpha/beta hydrolase n=1 Tax=Granulicella sp. dw_53 TaxID=2719792 RepID=UPI001BD28E5F|nr:alpha/beta hydrolase [Granulicella sp. dw_53]
MAHFIFLAGSELRALSWQNVQDGLGAHGHSSSTLDLADWLWASGFTSTIDAIVKTIPPRPQTILIGHSLAGIVVPLLAKRLDAICEIHIASLTRRAGQSFLDQLLLGEEIFDSAWAAGYEVLIRSEHPLITHHSFLHHHLFHDCPAGTADLFWKRSNLPLNTFYGFVSPLSESLERRCHYIVCANDRTIRPAWQREAARSLPGADVTEIATGHCPHIARPNALTDQILAITKKHIP